MADNSRVDPDGINSNSRLRASDRDRDQAASVVNEALAQGMLTPEEHSDRLDAIYAARTQADIVPLLDDLPQQPAAAPAVRAGEVVPGRRTSKIIAVLAGASRKGAWRAEPTISVVTVLGGAELDFREAILPGREVRIRALTLLGGLQVTVPPEMHVVDSAVAILGGTDTDGDTEESLAPDAPVLYISGACILGGIEVRRKARKQRKGLDGRRRPELEP
ncbi:MAG: DUF1707 domain-containing protein [Streptosporangiaceae bacterium]